MVYVNTIKKGLKVQVEVETGISRIRLDCYILEVDSDRLTLSFPESKSDIAPYLCEGSEIKAFIYTFNGITIFDSIVFDSPFDGQFIIEFSEKYQVIQRRKHIRVPYITDFYLIKDDGNQKAQTADISGGGVRFVSSFELKSGQEFIAQLRVNEYEPLIKVEGIILKKSFYKHNEYVLEFTKIEENDREKIVEKCNKLDKMQN